MTFFPFTDRTPRMLLTIPSGAYTAAQGSTGYTFDTGYIRALALDITFTSFAGGTSPSATFQMSRYGADGNWYPILPPAGSSASGFSPITFSAAGLASFDIGPFVTDADNTPVSNNYLGSAHAVLTSQARLTWSFTGAPTSATFSVSVVGIPHMAH